LHRLKVSAVVVLYNPDNKVLENIKTYSNKFSHIYLVDNSSKNNKNFFLDLKCNFDYIPLYKNYGIAKALNTGFTMSIKDGFNYTVSMDQDSSLGTDIVKVYSEFLMENDMENVAALTPQYATPRNNVSNITGSEKVLLSMQSGTMFVIDKYKKLGSFNEQLFLDCVDWEYFLRISENGYQTIQCNGAILDHNPASTMTLKIGDIVLLNYGIASPVRYYYQVRNLTWLIRKYKKLPTVINLFIKYIKVIVLFDDKGKYLTLCHKAFKDGINNRLGKYSE